MYSLRNLGCAFVVFIGMLYCITLTDFKAHVPQYLKQISNKPVRLDVLLETGQITSSFFFDKFLLSSAQVIFTKRPISFELVMCNQNPSLTSNFITPVIGSDVHLGKQTIVDLEHMARHEQGGVRNLTIV